MFTWVCPQCGREVPPAYSECPDCAARAAGGTAPPLGAAAPSQPPLSSAGRAGRRPLWATGPQDPPAAAPSPVTAPPDEAVPVYQPQQPVSPMFQTAPPPPPQYARPRGGQRLPTWALAVLFALGFGVVGSGVYWFFGPHQSQKVAATVESPAAKPGTAQNPLQKYIEITGLRFSPDSKGVQVAFVVINHSDSDLVGLAGNVTIWGRTQKSEEDAVGTFTFQTSMAAQSSKELTMPLNTKRKMVDMPDWQNVSVDVQITAPPGA
jgi:hypothetical protein